MISDISYDKRDTNRLAKLAKRFPKETRKGIGRAGATLRSQMRKVMRVGGGIHGVPAFEGRDPATEDLAELKNPVPEKLGGKLAKSAAIQMFSKTKEGFTVGFLSALEPWARAFQVAETRTMTTLEKIRFIRAGHDDTVYHRPARPVVDPFSRGARRQLLVWAVRNTEKILAEASK
jgi:hypothetical protein